MKNIETEIQKIMDDLEDYDSLYQRQILLETGKAMIARAHEVQELADSCNDTDNITIIATRIGVSSYYVNEVIDNVQKLIDNGMWFSDACEVVAILTDFKQKAKNFNDIEAVNEFWDVISDSCIVQTGVKPVIDMPMW